MTIDRIARFQVCPGRAKKIFPLKIAWKAYSPYHTTGRFSYGKSRRLILNTIYLSKSFLFFRFGQSLRRQFSIQTFFTFSYFLAKIYAIERKLKFRKIFPRFPFNFFIFFPPTDNFAIVWFIISAVACCACDIFVMNRKGKLKSGKT